MALEVAKGLRRSNENLSLSYLFASESQANQFAHSGNMNDGAMGACLVDGGTEEELGRAQDNDGEPASWGTNYSSVLAFQFETVPSASPSAVRPRRPSKGRHGDEVHAIHAERFVEGSGGHASLEITDAWFDPRSRGARVLGRSTLPLSRIFIGPNGLEVYAARDGEAMQVVFRTSDHPAEDPALADALRTRQRSMSVSLPDRSAGGSDCGHLRAVLRAPAGGGQMATLQSIAFLPPVDGNFGEIREGAEKDERGETMFRAMRQRNYQISVSATTSSADSNPVVSIALGWLGRERAGGS